MWGFNTNGLLGQNNRIQRSSPVQVGGAEWAELSVSKSAVAVKTNGTLWAWGQGDFGSIGDNAVVSRSSPVQIGALTNWLKPPLGSSDDSNSCLKTDGTLWTWGKNDLGQLGQNNIAPRSSPVQVGTLTNWSSVSMGADSFLSIAQETTN
jgi:alpha-tubulin suppressor-like RCC1 family protein